MDWRDSEKLQEFFSSFQVLTFCSATLLTVRDEKYVYLNN